MRVAHTKRFLRQIFLTFLPTLTLAMYSLIFSHHAYAQTYYTSGTFTPNNILETRVASSINAFGYNAIIPTDTSAKIQFSQDTTNWYSSTGTQDAWDNLQDGDFTSEPNAIDLDVRVVWGTFLL